MQNHASRFPRIQHFDLTENDIGTNPTDIPTHGLSRLKDQNLLILVENTIKSLNGQCGRTNRCRIIH